MTTQQIDIELRIAQFIAVRDKIKEIEERHKKELEPYKNLKDKLSVVLLDHLNTVNVDNASCGAGTVYRTAKKSASIADAEAFMRHVIGTESWDLLDRKANVTAVEDFIEEHKAPPPGVNFNQHWTVGVRRK